VIRATVKRGQPYCAQTTWKQVLGPTPHGCGGAMSYTMSDFSTRQFYRWDVTFTAPYGKFCNRSLYSHREAIDYADRTVREMRGAQ
jgi:hypothetical protein